MQFKKFIKGDKEAEDFLSTGAFSTGDFGMWFSLPGGISQRRQTAVPFGFPGDEDQGYDEKSVDQYVLQALEENSAVVAEAAQVAAKEAEAAA